MTIEVPIWLQNGTYPARLDRAFIDRVLHGAERVFDGLDVAQDGTGSFNVTVQPGAAAILGDDTTLQGMYFVRVTAAETIAAPASPGAGTRTDSIILRVNDPQAGGAAGDNATLEVISGTTIPSTAILLATIARSAGEAAILDAAITDRRPVGAYPYTVSTSGPPSGLGVEGDLWVTVA